jgi:hypothetical protein
LPDKTLNLDFFTKITIVLFIITQFSCNIISHRKNLEKILEEIWKKKICKKNQRLFVWKLYFGEKFTSTAGTKSKQIVFCINYCGLTTRKYHFSFIDCETPMLENTLSNWGGLENGSKFQISPIS